MEIQTYNISIFAGRLFEPQSGVAFFPCSNDIQIADEIKTRLVLLADEAEISRQYGRGLILDSRTFESNQTYHDITMKTTALGEFKKTGITYQTIFTKECSTFTQDDLNRIKHNMELESGPKNLKFRVSDISNNKLIISLDREGKTSAYGRLTEIKVNAGTALLTENGEVIIKQTTKGILGSNLEIFAKTISIVAKSL